MSEEVKENIVNENNTDDIFVKDTDVFSIDVRYYKNGKDLVVENVDTEFDINNNGIKSFSATFRYPSYLDSKSIYSVANIKPKPDSMIGDILALQDARIIVLFKSWTLSSGIDKIDSMNVKFIKAIRALIISSIGMEGIF